MSGMTNGDAARERAALQRLLRATLEAQALLPPGSRYAAAIDRFTRGLLRVLGRQPAGPQPPNGNRR